MAQEARRTRVKKSQTRTRELGEIPDPFRLPDGKSLRYAFPYERGNQYQWYRTWESRRLYEWRPRDKTKSIKLGLWNARGELFVIAADFDKVPYGFASFDQLEEFLKFIYRNAIVSRSFSNKVKCFFLVRFEGEMNRETASETLHKILGPDLFEGCDLSISALSFTFLTAKMARQLKHLSALTPIEAVVGHELERVPVDVNKDLTPRPMRRGTDSLAPELQAWVSRSPSRRQLMQILAASPQLLSRAGMDLPTTYLANECGCSPTHIWRFRESLIREGFLERISTQYRVGHKAMTYQARGELRESLRAKFPKMLQPPPDLAEEVIEPGTWNARLFELSLSYGSNLEAFRQEAAKLEGINEKDRWRKVETLIQQRQNRKAPGLKVV